MPERIQSNVLDLRPELKRRRSERHGRAIQRAIYDGDYSGLSPGSMVSGTQIADFTEGWAKAGWHSSAAHWYRLQPTALVALCGLRVESTPGIFGPGNFTRCGRCSLARSRLMKRGAM